MSSILNLPYLTTEPHIAFDITFTGTAVLAPVVTPKEVAESLLFQGTANTRVPKDLHAPLEQSVVPLALTPTNVHHQEIRKRLVQLGLPISDPRFPYNLQTRDGRWAALTLRIALLPPNVVVMTARLRGLAVGVTDFARDLIRIQRVDEHPYLRHIFTWTAGLVQSLNHRDYTDVPSKSIVPALHFRSPVSGTKTPAWLSDNETALVGIVIRNGKYTSMNAVIPRKMLEKNSDLNVKSDDERVLIDKQGLLYVSGDESGSRHFQRLVNLQGLALAFEAFLSNYSYNRTEAPEYFDFVLDKVERWVNTPGAVLRRSVATIHAWQLLCAEFQLAADVNTILSGSASARLAQTRELFDRMSHQWWQIDDFAERLSTELRAHRVDGHHTVG